MTKFHNSNILIPAWLKNPQFIIEYPKNYITLKSYSDKPQKH